MPPNKKKKKPASNPARGFATTSTASKSKDDGTKELESNVHLGVVDAHVYPNTAENGVRPEESPSRKPEKALCELTPEELELQLEDSSLQIVVESHGEKTKKGVSRNVSKIQTEKRLLRSQAEHLRIRQWLPLEIMQVIIDLLQTQEDSNIYLKANSDSHKAAPDPSEDDLLIRLWALKRLLPLLGFPEQRTDLALFHLLTKMNRSGLQSVQSGNEAVWGLDECIAWLGLNSEPINLPIFDSREGQSQPLATQKRSGIVASTPATTPSDSRPESPLDDENQPQQPQISEENGSLSPASDSDSDAEPEQLVTKYLGLQSRLHEISPELTEVDVRRQRRAKSKQLVVKGNLDPSTTRTIERLTAKINQIRSDLLFDADEADSRWAEVRIDLAQEAAERKRLGIRNDGEQQKFVPSILSSSKLEESSNDDDDTDGMLGGFFASLPDTATDPSTGLSIMSTLSQEGTEIEIRNFGKWTGMSPRRVLEEACKARWEFDSVRFVVFG